MASDDPAFLAVGTAVSAKYKGAFCESIVKKIDKNVKIKITYKLDNKTSIVSDEDLNGLLKVGSIVEVKKGDSKFEAIINRITDHSIYHVLFDDGDENSLKRSKLCLKGNKHFIKSTTLDGLPLTHPEHFWSPVIKGDNLKKTPTTPNPCSDSDAESDSEANVRSDQEIEPRDFFTDRRQDLVGRVVYSTNPEGPRKGQGPGNHAAVAVPLLVVLPGAEGNTPSCSKVLTKSFKDSRFISQSISSLKCVALEDLSKFKDKSLKLALDRASLYLTKCELPSSWVRSELLGFSSDEGDDDNDEDDADDYDKKRSSEMSDRFVAELYRFMEERGSPINCVPTISNTELDLYKLFHIVQRLGGYNKVTNQAKWHIVHKKMNFVHSITRPSEIKAAYTKYLHAFEDLDRKLGRFRPSSWSSKVSVGNRSIMSFRDRDPDLSVSAKNIHRIKKRKEEVEKVEIEPIKETTEKIQIAEASAKLTKTAKADLSDMDSNEDQNSKDQCQQIKSSEIQEPKRKLKHDDLNSIKSIQKDQSKKIKIKDKIDSRNVIDKSKENLCSELQKIRKTIEPKLLKENQQLKLVTRDGRFKEKKLEDKIDFAKSKEFKNLKVKDGATGSVSSKDGKEEDEDEMKRKQSVDNQIQVVGTNLDKNKRISRRNLGRYNSTINTSETKEENKLNKINTDIIYPIGTRLKVRYGDGKNTKIYGAKILESKQRNDCQMYLVHYNGWNSRYDDWINPSQIVDVLEESSEDQVTLVLPKSGRNRLKRYQRMSSSDTLSGKGDGDKVKNKKNIDSSDSNSDSDSNMGSDLNSEKSGSMKETRETPLTCHKFLPDEKGDNVVSNLKLELDVNKIEDEEKVVDTKFDESYLLEDVVGNSMKIEVEGEKHSPTFQSKIFLSSAFIRKESKEQNHKTQIPENRSVWKDDGRLNLNLAVSPIKTSPPTSPFFDAFQKSAEEFKFGVMAAREEEDRKVDEEYLWCTNRDNEGSDGDKNSPLETASSEGGAGEENASTKSDREANREVEAYMAADYTVLDRKADYVMLNRLPGDAVSYYVPSLDDSSDASSAGRIACPKPILPYVASSARKDDLVRKRKKKKVPTATLR